MKYNNNDIHTQYDRLVRRKQHRMRVNAIKIIILLLIALIILSRFLMDKIERNEVEKESTKNSVTFYANKAASAQHTSILEEDIEEEEMSIEEIIEESLGESFSIDGFDFKLYDTPDKYYPNMDFKFQPYMSYNKVTNKKSEAYKINHSSKSYTDEHGLRRYKVEDDQFSINGEDDYVIALGTYYKPKGVCGTRYLVVTTNGMYTAITGDEKDDRHTDSRNMFSKHGNNAGGIIEWIVDTNKLDDKIKRGGSIHYGDIDVLRGSILYIYGIEWFKRKDTILSFLCTFVIMTNTNIL